MPTSPQKSEIAKMPFTRIAISVLLIGTLIAVNIGAAIYLLYLKPHETPHLSAPSSLPTPHSKDRG